MNLCSQNNNGSGVGYGLLSGWKFEWSYWNQIIRFELPMAMCSHKLWFTAEVNPEWWWPLGPGGFGSIHGFYFIFLYFCCAYFFSYFKFIFSLEFIVLQISLFIKYIYIYIYIIFNTGMYHISLYQILRMRLISIKT